MAKEHALSMASKNKLGPIRADELYSKLELLQRMGISQKTWDDMLDQGLPFAQFGKCRWVSGQDLIDFFNRTSQRKSVADAEP